MPEPAPGGGRAGAAVRPGGPALGQGLRGAELGRTGPDWAGLAA